jgi:hypothetical protein
MIPRNIPKTGGSLTRQQIIIHDEKLASGGLGRAHYTRSNAIRMIVSREI